jgi:hypothetical protein
VEASKNANVPRQALPLVVELSQFAQFETAQGGPTGEENRHSLITAMPRIEKLAVVEQ